MKLLLILVLVALPLLAPTPARAQSQVVNGIVAIVNSAVVTKQDVEDMVALTEDLLRRQYARQPEVYYQKLNEARGEALERLVERKLILHDFKTSGYNMPESVIEDAIQDRVRERFGDRLRLTKTLQAQGTTYENYRTQIREQIIVDALRARHISRSIIISPYKIETYYQEHPEEFQQKEQVKLRMIVINQPPGAPEGTAQRMAREVLLKLEEGVPFAEMAGVYSEGSQRAEGGDRGWVAREVLNRELDEVAFSLQPGQRSGVIVLADACYLLQVDERKPAGLKPLSEVRDEIEKRLLAEEQARLQKKYIDRLKSKSFVRYF